MTHLDGDEPLFSTLSVHTEPILEALQRLKVQRDVLRQDVSGDEAHDLLVRAWEVRARLVDEPLFAAHTVLSTLVLRERQCLVSRLHNTDSHNIRQLQARDNLLLIWNFNSTAHFC